MPKETQYVNKLYPWGGTYRGYEYSHNWQRSPRIGNKLLLRANPWSLFVVERTRTLIPSPHGSWVVPLPIGEAAYQQKFQRARSVRESDLRGQLARKIRNKEYGSLGVAIATTTQSIAMMRGSADQLVRILAGASQLLTSHRGRKRLKRLRRRIRYGARVTAGMVLEGFFGWAPLISDFGAAAKTAANPWPNRNFVSSSVEYEVKHLEVDIIPGRSSKVSRWSAKGRSSFSTSLQVSNPLTWIANKLGLLNPLVVAWDLVPWSFLANMFSNMGQVMGALTDFSGLTLSNSSLTRGEWYNIHSDVLDIHPVYGTASGREALTGKRRTREDNVQPPPVVPYLRFPEWQVGTAAILGSLLIQNTNRISRLLSSD